MTIMKIPCKNRKEQKRREAELRQQTAPLRKTNLSIGGKNE